MRYQLRLRELGFDIEADGVVGRETRRAVRSFQRENDLEPTGTFGPLTKRALRHAERDTEEYRYDGRDQSHCLPDPVHAHSKHRSTEANARSDAQERWMDQV